MKRIYFSNPNEDIYIAKGDIPLRVLANYFGVHENTVRNWLKYTLSEEKKTEIMVAIEEINKERKTPK